MFHVTIVWPSNGDSETHKLATIEECISLLAMAAERDEFVSFSITYVEPTETELDSRVVGPAFSGTKVRD